MIRHSAITGFAALLVCALLLPGCVKQAVYLQHVEMTGPIAPPAVHVTEHQQEGEFRVSPRFAYSTESHLSAQFLNNVASSSNSQITAARIGNVNWIIPRTTVGTDVQYFLSNHVAVTSGLTFAAGGGSSFWEGHMGLGLCATGENLAARLDGGVQWRSFRYDVQALIATSDNPWSSNQEITSMKDVWSESQVGFYCGITLNTCYETSPVNGFLNFGLTRHSLGDLREMRRGLNGELINVGFIDQPATALWMLSLSPGLSFRLSQRERVLIGARFITGSELEQANPEYIAVPFVQIDLSF